MASTNRLLRILKLVDLSRPLIHLHGNGVGAKRVPPVWMKPGDTVEIEVGKVGVLVNSIAADSSAY